MKLLFTIFLLLVATIAFGQVAPEVSYDEFIAFLMKSLGGVKGASSMAIAVLVAQVGLKLIQTSAGELLGKYKLLVVAGLTMLVSIVGMMVTGTELLPALLGSSGIAAVQVFLHQIYKQFFEKKV